MGKILIDNYRGKWVEPFQREVLTVKVACRFCKQRVDKVRRSFHYTPEHKAQFMMEKGQEAIHLITSTGPVGDAFVCIPCAKGLLKNLQRELTKVKT